MALSKQELVKFLDDRIYKPALRNPHSTRKIIRKVHCTRLRLRRLKSAKAIRLYFWNSLSTDDGLDSYKHLHPIDKARFEETREEFEILCGKK